MAFGIVDFPFPCLQCVQIVVGCVHHWGRRRKRLYKCRSSAARVLGRLLAAPSCGVLVGGRGDDGALFFSQVLVPRGSVRLQPWAALLLSSAEPLYRGRFL